MSEQGSELQGGRIEVRDQVAAEDYAGRSALQRDEPEKITSIDAEYLSGKRFPYQEDRSLVEDVDLMAATPGKDINWLEDITLLTEDGVPAVFDRYSNAFIKIYFDIPEGREDELARKVLINLPNVKDLHTSFSLGEVKASSELPLGHLNAAKAPKA